MGPIPRIPAGRANVFRSSVRHCIIKLHISKDRWVVGPTQPTGNDSRGKASKARLSDGRRRPPVARRDRRDKAETILWRRFQSGPVIVVVEVKRDLGSVFFALSYRRIVGRRAFDRKTMLVEGIRLRRRRRREVDGTIAWIPEICADVFGSSVRPRLMELSISKANGLISGTTHRQHVALAIKASKARLSNGRRRPAACSSA